MSKKLLRVAAIGTGIIANAGHIPAWQSLKEAEVLGVAGTQVDRARGTAQRHGIPHSFESWRRMLAELEPDAVSICTPNATHAESLCSIVEWINRAIIGRESLGRR
jgi:predicted dehydrogenase